MPPDKSKGWQEKSEKMKYEKANKSNEIVMWNELRGKEPFDSVLRVKTPLLKVVFARTPDTLKIREGWCVVV